MKSFEVNRVKAEQYSRAHAQQAKIDGATFGCEHDCDDMHQMLKAVEDSTVTELGQLPD